MSSVLKYKFDDFEADLRAAELLRNGTRLKLQLQPFQVLVALLERPKEVVVRDQLRQRLWPEDTFVDFDHGLNTAMVKLRDVLGDSASKPKYIETIAKRGYRFLGEVHAVLDPSTPVQGPAPVRELSPNVPAEIKTATDANLQVETGLPRASRGTARLLFVLSQVMYLIFYLSALFRWETLAQAADMAWRSVGTIAFVVYLVSALVGLAVRLYLISATAMDYHLLGKKYRILVPGLFLLDMIWALAPFLLADRIGLGFALGATAALIYMPFAQRILVKMIDRRP
jgi:DNA-binding winged helix-turn-helix (wHTH) protein